MKNIIMFSLLILTAVWACSDESESEEVVKEQLVYNVTCYSSNGSVAIESKSHAHPGTGLQSSYAWKDIDGIYYETSLRCKSDQPPPILSE